MDIIRKIYNGDYCPTDQEPPGSPEYQAVRAGARILLDLLGGCL